MTSHDESELRVKDVAQHLGVTPARVYQLINDGTLPATRRGRAVRIPRAAWDAWLDRQVEQAMMNLSRNEDGPPNLHGHGPTGGLS